MAARARIGEPPGLGHLDVLGRAGDDVPTTRVGQRWVKGGWEVGEIEAIFGAARGHGQFSSPRSPVGLKFRGIVNQLFLNPFPLQF